MHSLGKSVTFLIAYILTKNVLANFMEAYISSPVITFSYHYRHVVIYTLLGLLYPDSVTLSISEKAPLIVRL